MRVFINAKCPQSSQSGDTAAVMGLHSTGCTELQPDSLNRTVSSSPTATHGGGRAARQNVGHQRHLWVAENPSQSNRSRPSKLGGVAAKKIPTCAVRSVERQQPVRFWMGPGHGSSRPADYLTKRRRRRLRQPPGGSDDADRRPAGSRSRPHGLAIPPAAGLDCRARAIGAGGLHDNIRSRIRETSSAAVH